MAGLLGSPCGRARFRFSLARSIMVAALSERLTTSSNGLLFFQSGSNICCGMIKCVAVNTQLSFKRSRIEASLD